MDVLNRPSRYISVKASFVTHLLEYIDPRYPYRVITIILRHAAENIQDEHPPIPPNVSLCLRKVCSSPFRRDDGRVFTGGFGNDVIDEDDPATFKRTEAANILAGWNGLLDGSDVETVVGAGFIPVVWLRSRQVGGELAMPVVSRIEQFALSDLYVDSQIRRIPHHTAHGRRRI